MKGFLFVWSPQPYKNSNLPSFIFSITNFDILDLPLSPAEFAMTRCGVGMNILWNHTMTVIQLKVPVQNTFFATLPNTTLH